MSRILQVDIGGYGHACPTILVYTDAKKENFQIADRDTNMTFNKHGYDNDAEKPKTRVSNDFLFQVEFLENSS